MGHTYSNLLVHAVFSTKGRQPLIQESLCQRLHKEMYGIAKREFGTPLEIGGTEDHIHGLLVLPCRISVADAMRAWKSLSSGWVNDLRERRGQKPFAWQSGYGAFSVSQSNVPTVKRYIQRQVEHHKRLTFQEEFLELLRRHEIEYDPQYVWD